MFGCLVAICKMGCQHHPAHLTLLLFDAIIKVPSREYAKKYRQFVYLPSIRMLVPRHLSANVSSKARRV